jgi:hypothetical protein
MLKVKEIAMLLRQNQNTEREGKINKELVSRKGKRLQNWNSKERVISQPTVENSYLRL